MSDAANAQRFHKETLEWVRDSLLDISEGSASSVELTPEEAEVLLNLPGLTAPSFDDMRSY